MHNLRQYKIYEFENFRLDADSKLLFRGGEQIALTPRAVEILIALIEGEGEVVKRDELMEKVWVDTIVEDTNIAHYLYVLRKTLGSTSDGRPFIETLKRRGYRFNGTVHVVENGSSHSFTKKSGNVEEYLVEQIDSQKPGVNVQAVGSFETSHKSPVIPPSHSKFRSLPLILVVCLLALAGIVFGVRQFTIGNGKLAVSENVPFQGSDMVRMTTAGKSKRAAISPDGRYVAHVIAAADGESVWVRQIAVGNDTRIAGPFQSDLGWVTFSPDGNFVHYLSLERDKGESELFRVPVLGGPIQKVANDVGPISFSPDGTKFAFMQMNQYDGELIVANADGSAEELIVTRRPPDYLNIYWTAPAWSLDGRSLAFAVNQTDEHGRYETVIVVDIATRIERKLSDIRWQRVGQPRWLQDGIIVAASETAEGADQLWHISSADGAASRITRDINSYGNLSLTSDLSTLAVTQKHNISKIWTLEGDTSPGKELRSEVGRLDGVIWLPDGRLAYTSNAGGGSDIWTMNADGTGVRQLTVGANARLGLSLTADGKHFIFAAQRNGKYNLWRIETDGSNLAQVTYGDAELFPQCTPDGRWIVYQSSLTDPSIWKMPIGGGEPVQISSRGGRPSISPDGKFVAYNYLDPDFERSRWSIGISDVEAAKRVRRFDFPSTVVDRLVKWTPDGRSIAFINSPGAAPNVWLQPVGGGEPKPLTTFSSDNIISFNWNTDGSQLAVIRTVETSDVLLINRFPSR